MRIGNHPCDAAEPLPLVYQPENEGDSGHEALTSWIRGHREELFASLHQRGGILFRGFAFQDAEEFGRVAAAATSELQPYMEGQSPRTKIAKDVYTSTEHPPRLRITLHNELSYALHPPAVIVFGCQTPAATGGETPIVDCRRVYQNIDPAIRKRFAERGVLYIKHMHGDVAGMGKSWMDHFETADRAVVEDYLRSHEVSFRWTEAGGLRTESRRPAVRQHPVTGEWIWFNQANLWHIGNLEPNQRDQMLRTFGEENLPTHAYFGDGSPISDEELDHIQRALWDPAVIFSWQQGDILVLDNFMVAHGRMPFAGTRRIVVAMGGS